MWLYNHFWYLLRQDLCNSALQEARSTLLQTLSSACPFLVVWWAPVVLLSFLNVSITENKILN